MSTIFYSIMGEGRGHAARARTIVEEMRSRHRIVLFTSHDALAFLSKQYGESSDVEVREIPGLKFHYSEKKLNLIKTINHGLGMWWNKEKLIAPLAEVVRDEKPDLVISDFEPLLARAAHRTNVPVLSFDHQHFLVAYDLSSLPSRLQWWAKSMSLAVWMFGIGQQKTVVSAFYKPPLRPGFEDVVQVGPLLRPTIRNRETTTGDFVLSYLRRQTPERVVDVLVDLGVPIRIYGLGPREPRGSAEFCEIDEDSFTEALVNCSAVIAASGNQLCGEALHLGKPMFAIPEGKHFEQCINASFVKELGAGDWAAVEEVKREQFEEFLADRETYRQNLTGRRAEFDGTPAAVAAIEEMLCQSGTSVTSESVVTR
ncbi:teichoic acid biosynthesis protein [Aeoliella sp. ICT_H6.2]|uniref:Teichoic acid biosynthesis protein n=1 Tax=Aeoliella straminimaris TaxID=2954799 RepID=A0A9X2FFN8_9BACT|nr:glycosyltransferase family protein [Aeoliella straminimaris]MCO6047403.1 teichoic acid biosynthesis protein [Aeoliella straminimaris]